jgi:hypothetical protein
MFHDIFTSLANCCELYRLIVNDIMHCACFSLCGSTCARSANTRFRCYLQRAFKETDCPSEVHLC